MRKSIVDLEHAMKQMHDLRIECEVTHYFAPGIYMRQVLIPKGATVVGKIHKTEHLNILSQGQLIVWTEDGMKHLKASTVIKSQPGMKRVGHALSDAVWITVHHNPSNEQDVDKLEDLLVVDNFEQFKIFMDEQKAISKEGS